MLNKTYISHVHGKSNCFITNLKSHTETKNTIYSMSITLLPHQVLIMPYYFHQHINIDVSTIDLMREYTADECR
jgi:hypothetical protein